MKKFFAIASIAALLVIILAGTGAVAFYSNTSNCSNCHEMKSAYESWRVSSHSSVSCESCHRRNPSEGLISTKGTAISRIIAHFLKDKKEPKAHVGKENCLRCHSSIKRTIKASSDSHIVNPHPVHLAAGFVCAHCHKQLIHSSNISASTKPQMANCVNCHRSKEVSVECTTCHYGTQEHITKIAGAGGYVLKQGEDCQVCHTEKDVSSTNHKEAILNIGGYNGVKTCSRCHVYCRMTVEGSVHSRLKTKVAHVEGLKEERGMASKSAKPALWANKLQRKDGVTKDTGCGQCHVGGSNVPTPQMASEVDCLICHAKNYDMKKRKIVMDGKVGKWVGDDSLEVAATVGKPEAEYCWRCHEDHMAHTRGTPFTPEADVHAKAGMACQSCHVTIAHKIAKGSVADMMANDIPELAVSCTSCHVDHKHGVKKIDVHLQRLACQSCHVGKVEGMAIWDKTKGVDKDKDGFFEDNKIDKHDISPTFYWFNGKADENGMPIGSKSDKKAKLYPFKVITQKMAVDVMTKKPVNGSAIVFALTGNFDVAVRKLAEVTGLPQPPKWITVEAPKIQQLNHAIDSKGMDCGNCHAKEGMMDFTALGYSKSEVKTLSQPQSYAK